uniref:Uncharacterized protein n=1 Tax=Anguilla anguilla TaxID=7936 RepID=A0A0E9RRP5_ANGAN
MGTIYKQYIFRYCIFNCVCLFTHIHMHTHTHTHVNIFFKIC